MPEKEYDISDFNFYTLKLILRNNIYTDNTDYVVADGENTCHQKFR
jgi:hypothetical protein